MTFFLTNGSILIFDGHGHDFFHIVLSRRQLVIFFFFCNKIFPFFCKWEIPSLFYLPCASVIFLNFFFKFNPLFFFPLYVCAL